MIMKMKILLVFTLALIIMLTVCVLFYEIFIHILKKDESELDGFISAMAILLIGIFIFGSFTIAIWIVF